MPVAYIEISYERVQVILNKTMNALLTTLSSTETTETADNVSTSIEDWWAIFLATFCLCCPVAKVYSISGLEHSWIFCILAIMGIGTFAAIALVLIYLASGLFPIGQLMYYTVTSLTALTICYTWNYCSPDWGQSRFAEIQATALLGLWTGNQIACFALRK